MQVTVYFVPAVCVFGEVVGVPAGDVAFNKFEPDFLVFFGELGDRSSIVCYIEKERLVECSLHVNV